MKKEWIVNGAVNYDEYTYKIKIRADNLRQLDDVTIDVDGVLITLPEQIEGIERGAD